MPMGRGKYMYTSIYVLEGGVFTCEKVVQPFSVGSRVASTCLPPARSGRQFELAAPVEDYAVFYVGSEGPSLINLLLGLNKCQVRHHTQHSGGPHFNSTLLSCFPFSPFISLLLLLLCSSFFTKVPQL